MTNNLTPEQIADGWKHISEIVNEPDGFVQLGDFCPYKPDIIVEGSAIYIGDIDCYPKSDFYRRLIPALPNQVVISREDAEVISSGGQVDWGVEIDDAGSRDIFTLSKTRAKFKIYNDALTRLQAKLEGK